MFKQLSVWIQKKSSTGIVIGSLVIMLLFTVFVLPRQAESALEKTGSAVSPDTKLIYTPAEIYHLAEIYGAEGRQAYIYARWTFDLIFPLVYIFFLTTGISWFNKKLPKSSESRKLLNLLPVVGGVFDYFENTAASVVMSKYPEFGAAAYLAPPLSLIKWSLITLAFGAYLLNLTLYLISIGRKKKE